MKRYRYRTFFAAVLLLLSVITCMPVHAQEGSREASEAFWKASWNLFRQVVMRSDGNENVLISPDSVITAMMVVENGASGKTLKEMSSAFGGATPQKYNSFLSSLHRSLSASKGVTYTSANSIWYNRERISLKKSFLNRVRESFDAEVEGTRFDAQAAAKINRWVSSKTRKKIRKIIDRLEPSDRAVVVNAVYFKGSWAEPYSGTVKRRFTDAEGKVSSVNMLEGVESTYVSLKKGKGFVKPYSGGRTAFLGLLPPKGMSVKEYAAGLTAKDLINAYRKRKTENVVVRTRMPEFTCSYGASMKKPLQKMGIRRAFTNQADFSKMSKQRLRIDDVVQKAYIKLDKSGTEAAAATAVVMKASSFRPQTEPKVYKVYLNRPFVYAIIDTVSGVPLFMGVVNHVE